MWFWNDLEGMIKVGIQNRGGKGACHIGLPKCMDNDGADQIRGSVDEG